VSRTVTERPLIRCAIYTRQSVARETDLTSCDVQRELCEAFIGSMQYEGWVRLPDRFDDLGVGGGTLDRPALRRLIRAISSGLVDQVVVHRFDRLTRSLRDWVVLRELFDEAGVELTSVASGHDGRGSVLTGFINNVLASFGEFEREIIGERLRESRGARRARGLRSSGRVPFGYRANPATKQLAAHLEEAEIVREFFRRAAAGETAEAIARWANEQAITTKANRKRAGVRWSGRTILQLIRSPLYFGKVLSGPAFVAGVQPAIVDEGLAIAAWETIARRRTREPSRRSLLPIEQDPYLLRHVLLCGKCTGQMTTSASRAVTIENADEVARYYRCRGSSQSPACRPTVQVSASEVEQEVLRQLQAPGSMRDLSPNARRFLKNIVPLWPSLPRGELNYWVRTLVWAATWNPDTRKVDIVFDEIGIENAMKENPVLAEPLPEKVLKRLAKKRPRERG
jgi:site-specific DNA recombinase